MGLEDLEPLVHHGGGVDGDLGPHVPRGMRQGVGGHDRFEFARHAPPERAAGCGEDAARHPAAIDALEQLEKGGMLAVDRHQASARARAGCGHQVAAGHERLLVGQRHGDAALDRREGRRKPRCAHERVQHDVRLRRVDEVAEIPRVRHGAPTRCSRGECDAPGARLRGHLVGPPPACQAHALHVVGGVDDVQRLHADRARGAEDEDARHESEGITATGVHPVIGACPDVVRRPAPARSRRMPPRGLQRPRGRPDRRSPQPGARSALESTRTRPGRRHPTAVALGCRCHPGS